jgi:HPt (histidine-containing phosphotransfer) domain-containing protein
VIIDTDSALKRVGGNRKLLTTLLKRFTSETFLEQLKSEVAAKDYATAAKTAHGIKGVAANLSLTGLYSAVVTLEQQLKNGLCEEKAFADTEQAYSTTISEINQMVP